MHLTKKGQIASHFFGGGADVIEWKTIQFASEFSHFSCLLISELNTKSAQKHQPLHQKCEHSIGHSWEDAISHKTLLLCY